MALIRIARLADETAWLDMTISEATLEGTTWTITSLAWANNSGHPVTITIWRANGTVLATQTVADGTSGSVSVTGPATSRRYASYSVGM